MSFIDLFSERADLYASARPRYPQALFDFVASLAPARRRAWDCACGNGQAAVSLAQRFDAVEATDASAAQIEHALPAPGVRYSVQAAEMTDFGPGSFDAVCVAQALHWFDFERFWPEVRRVLRPGGVFAAWGYDALQIEPAFDAAIRQCVLDVIQPYWAAQNTLLRNGYRDVPFPLARLAAPSFAIEVDWTLAQLFGYIGTWSATRRFLAERDAGFLVRAQADVTPLWGNPDAPRQVSMPLRMLAGRHD